MPARMIIFMAALPCFALLSARGGRRAALALALAPVIVAEAGRRRAGAPLISRLPVRCLLRPGSPSGQCASGSPSPLALRGNGVRYGRGRLTHAATPSGRLRSEKIAAFHFRDEPVGSEVSA